MQYVFNTNEVKRYQFPTHTNDLVMDRADASTSEVFIVVLNPGEAPPPHKHDDTEQVFYVLEGKGRLAIGGEEEELPVNVGDVVRIPPSVLHYIEAEGDGPLRYLAVDCFVGGRPEAEPTWNSHVRVICQNEGWDYDKVVKK
jgi:mannose-6-phosphate isomerase-like protein (cupin superfamily)